MASGGIQGTGGRGGRRVKTAALLGLVVVGASAPLAGVAEARQLTDEEIQNATGSAPDPGEPETNEALTPGQQAAPVHLGP